MKNIQTVSGAQPVPCSWVMGGTIPRGQGSSLAEPAPKSDINGAIPPLPLHLFLVSKGTNPFLYFFRLW